MVQWDICMKQAWELMISQSSLLRGMWRPTLENVISFWQQDVSEKGKEICKMKGVVSTLWNAHGQDSIPGSSEAVAWCPLGEGCIKINVYAAYCENFGYAAVRIIARNSIGEVLFAAIQFLNLYFDPENAEECAMKFAVQQALNHCTLPVVLEADSVL